MKSFSARLSVVALAVAGFSASTVASIAAVNSHSIKPVFVGSCTPAPLCAPSSNPNPCKDSMD